MYQNGFGSSSGARVKIELIFPIAIATMTDDTTAIRLYRKTYQLPKLDRPDLVLIQNQIQERQQIGVA